MKNTVFLILLLVSSQLFGVEQSPLNGNVSIAGKLGYKGPENGNSHLYLSFAGKTAKALYDAINIEAYLDECTGKYIKFQNSMTCYKTTHNESYSCNFSIDLETSKIGTGLGNCM